MTSPEQQPAVDEQLRADVDQAAALVGPAQDPTTMDVLDLIGAITGAADAGTLPHRDGSAPLPAHVTCAVDYPTCPTGAEPGQWAESEPYRSGWIDMTETGRAYDGRAGEPDYRAGVIAAAKQLHDTATDQPS